LSLLEPIFFNYPVILTEFEALVDNAIFFTLLVLDYDYNPQTYPQRILV